MTALYERIGRGYARARQPDPEIAAAIRDAIGPGRSVVNVGAGAGSYEPSDCAVIAVEPSRAMITQRPAGSARAIQAVAEWLPFADGAFEVALATLTTHHWLDWRAGIAEMKRVARRRIAVLTFDPAVSHRFWLVRDYLPSIANLGTDTFSFGDVAEAIGGEVRIVMVPAGCRDGFLAAYWRRPQRYLDPEVSAGISAFHALPEEELHLGLAGLEADIQSGAWAKRNDDLLHASAFDGGYRLVVADL